jgi:hypothetical protein
MNKSKIIKNGTVNLLKLQQLQQQDKRDQNEVTDIRIKKDMIDCELPGNAVTISPSDDDGMALALRVRTILTLRRWVFSKIRMPFNPTDRRRRPLHPFPFIEMRIQNYRTPI